MVVLDEWLWMELSILRTDARNMLRTAGKLYCVFYGCVCSPYDKDIAAEIPAVLVVYAIYNPKILQVRAVSRALLLSIALLLVLPPQVTAQAQHSTRGNYRHLCHMSRVRRRQGFR